MRFVHKVHSRPVLACIAVLFFAFWVYDVNFFGPYNADVGGNAAEWTGGLLTGAAFVVAALAYRQEVRAHAERDLNNRRAGALAVVADVRNVERPTGQIGGTVDQLYGEVIGGQITFGYQVEYLVSNHGAFPIRDIVIQTWWLVPTQEYSNLPPRTAEPARSCIGVIRPGDPCWTTQTRWLPEEMDDPSRWEVSWSDGWGVRWVSENGGLPQPIA